MLYKTLEEILTGCGVQIFGAVLNVACPVLKLVADGPGEQRRNDWASGESGDSFQECALVHDDFGGSRAACCPVNGDDTSFLLEAAREFESA
jgi:hypothetical protein